jgi:uncharacterized coiled-coil protein SlyX
MCRSEMTLDKLIKAEERLADLESKAVVQALRIRELENGLREAMQWDWLTEPKLIPESVVAKLNELMASK